MSLIKWKYKIVFSEVNLLKNIFNQLSDPLFKTSFYIILTSIAAAGFGFVFWLIAAKLYSQSDVGIATALFSSISLLVLLSRLGLDQSIIRFFPERDKSQIFNTSIIVTTVVALILGVIFILGIPLWSPDLNIIYQSIPIYLIILAANSVFTLAGTAFVALRRANFYFFQNLFVGIRIIFLFPLVFLGALGIFYSIGVAFILALIIPIYIFYQYKLKISKINIPYLRESFNFSAGNYLISIFSLLPTFLLPIIVLNLIGSDKTAIYYIVYSIASLLFIVPSAFSTSLFVEGSHGQALKQTAIKSLLGILALLIPLIIIIVLFGRFILGLIGSTYIEGFDLLVVLILSSLGMIAFQLYSSIKKAQKKIKSVIFLSFLTCILLLGLSYIFLLEYGIIGVGYAWFISYGLISILIILYMKKNKIMIDT